MSDAPSRAASRRGRTLKLYLVDGSPSGVITAELGISSVRAAVASRTALPDLIRREEAMLGDDRRIVARLLDVFDVWMSPGASAAANADLRHLVAGHPGLVDHRMLLEHEEVRIILRVALTELSRSAAVRGDGERRWLTLATGEDGQRDILRSREDFRRFFEALMRPITAG